MGVWSVKGVRRASGIASTQAAKRQAMESVGMNRRTAVFPDAKRSCTRVDPAAPLGGSAARAVSQPTGRWSSDRAGGAVASSSVSTGSVLSPAAAEEVPVTEGGTGRGNGGALVDSFVDSDCCASRLERASTLVESFAMVSAPAPLEALSASPSPLSPYSMLNRIASAKERSSSLIPPSASSTEEGCAASAPANEERASAFDPFRTCVRL